MSDNTIELLPIKPKRVYKRKPKEVVPECVAPHTTRLGGEPHSDSESSTTSLTPILSLEVPETQPKPKRSYSRKPKCVAPVVEPLVDPPTQTKSNIRLTTELIDTPPSSPKCVEPHTTRLGGEPQVKEKKQRTEKQIAAFNKMRDARLAKQEELNRLKELEKEEKRISSEKSKLDKVTEQVINKATEIKKKRASRKKEVVDECVEPHTTRLGGEPQFREPQQISIIKETKYKPILFV